LRVDFERGGGRVNLSPVVLFCTRAGYAGRMSPSPHSSWLILMVGSSSRLLCLVDATLGQQEAKAELERLRLLGLTRIRDHTANAMESILHQTGCSESVPTQSWGQCVVLRFLCKSRETESRRADSNRCPAHYECALMLSPLFPEVSKTAYISRVYLFCVSGYPPAFAPVTVTVTVRTLG